MKKYQLLALPLLFLFASIAYAVSLPNGTGIFETSLASRITSTDTTMTLVSNSANGETVNGYDCFTIDEGRSEAEYVCGTVSGTTVTGLERGISYANGTTTSTLRAHVHRVGADVKKTDFPLIQRLRNVANGTEGLPNIIGYVMHPNFSGALGTAIPDITYVAGLIGGGAGVPLSVNIGGTGAPTLPSMLLQGNGTNPITGTSTPTVSAIVGTSTATSTFAGPVNNTFSGASTSTYSGNVQVSGSLATVGTTTIGASSVTGNALILNGIAYRFPTTQGASSTSLQTNGSGGLAFLPGQINVVYSNAALISSGTTTMMLSGGTLTTSNKITLMWHHTSPSVQTPGYIVIGSGTSSTTIQNANNATGWGRIDIAISGASSEKYFGTIYTNTTPTIVDSSLSLNTANNIYIAFGSNGATFEMAQVYITTQ